MRLGLDLGLTLIDTAEMYGDGAAEELVAEAVAGRRDEVFIVNRVLPANGDASRDDRGVRAQPRAAGNRPHRHVDLAALMMVAGGDAVETDQVLYNLSTAGSSSSCSRGAATGACRSWPTRRRTAGGELVELDALELELGVEPMFGQFELDPDFAASTNDADRFAWCAIAGEETATATPLRACPGSRDACQAPWSTFWTGP